MRSDEALRPRASAGVQRLDAGAAVDAYSRCHESRLLMSSNSGSGRWKGLLGPNYVKVRLVAYLRNHRCGGGTGGSAHSFTEESTGGEVDLRGHDASCTRNFSSPHTPLLLSDLICDTASRCVLALHLNR